MLKLSLKKFFDVKTEIYKYFGLELEYYPIYDYTDQYWTADDACIQWGSSAEEVEEYCEDIHNKCIYRGDDYTMVFVEECHHNEVYQIYDNKKEVKEKED